MLRSVPFSLPRVPAMRCSSTLSSALHPVHLPSPLPGSSLSDARAASSPCKQPDWGTKGLRRGAVGPLSPAPTTFLSAVMPDHCRKPLDPTQGTDESARRCAGQSATQEHWEPSDSGPKASNCSCPTVTLHSAGSQLHTERSVTPTRACQAATAHTHV